MDFINKAGNTLGVVARDAADKARKVKEVIGLKGQISACEEVVEKNYIAIGRLYYEKYGETADAEFAKQCGAIRNAQKGVEELQEKLREVKAK